MGKEKAQRGRQDRSRRTAPSSPGTAARTAQCCGRVDPPAVVGWFYDDGSSLPRTLLDLLDWRPAGYAVVSRWPLCLPRPASTADEAVLHDSDEDRNRSANRHSSARTSSSTPPPGRRSAPWRSGGSSWSWSADQRRPGVGTTLWTYYPAGDWEEDRNLPLTDTSAAPASAASPPTSGSPGSLTAPAPVPSVMATGWRNDVSVTLTRVDTRGGLNY